MTNIKHYILPLDNVDLAKILSTWTWLVDASKSVIALTKTGDAVLKDTYNKLYFLDTGGGELKLISENYLDFIEQKLDDEVVQEMLLPPLVDLLEENGKQLTQGKVYSYTLLPILGGLYDQNNLYPLDIYEHYSLTGDLHYQLKDTPDGTRVDVVVK